MRYLVIASAAALFALAAPTASAQGAYIGGSLGQSRIGLDCAGTTTCDKTGNAYKIFGGYMFTPIWGIEGQYYNQGKSRATGTGDPLLGDWTSEFKGDGFGIYGRAVGTAGNAAFFGKLGVASAKLKLSATSSLLGAAEASKTLSDISWGVGMDYSFSKPVAGRLEYERVRTELAGVKQNVDTLSLGVLYKF